MSRSFVPGVIAVAAVLSCLLPGVRVRAQDVLPEMGNHSYWRTLELPASGILGHPLQVLEADDGVPWLETTAGVAWYDGYRWIRSAASDLPELGAIDTATTAIGSGLVLTGAGSLILGNQDGFRAVAMTLAGANYNVTAAVPLDSSTILVRAALPRLGASVQAALFTYRDGVFARFRSPARLIAGRRGLLRRGRSGTVWITTSAGLYSLGPEGWRLRLTAGNVPLVVEELEENQDGIGLLYLKLPSDLRGVWRWSGAGPLKPLTGTDANYVQTLDVSPTGTGLVALDSQEMIAIEAGHGRMEPGLARAFGNVRDIRFGTVGALWLLQESAVQVLDRTPPIWTSWERAADDLSARIHEILPRRNGSVWLATADGIRIRSTDGSMRTISKIDGQALGVITGLAEDKESHVWVVGGENLRGAFRWNGERWNHVGAAEGLAEGSFHRIATDRAGRLWFLGLRETEAPISDSAGLGAFMLEDGRFDRVGPQEGLPSGQVYGFAETPDGARWFATAKGISRLQGAVWRHWSMATELHGGRVFDIAAGSDGTIYFARQTAELGMITPSGAVQYMESPLAEIWRIVPHTDGSIWLGGVGGVACLMDGDFFALGTSTGLPNPNVWPVTFVGDTLLAGTRGSGVAVLQLANRLLMPPRVELREPAVDMAAAWTSWGVHTWWSRLPAERVETRYRVDENSWSAWSRERQAAVADLSPGEHRFTVQAKGLRSHTSTTETTATFDIARPLRQDPRFYLPIYGLLVAVAVLAVVSRRHRLRQRSDRRHAADTLRNIAVAVSADTGEGFFRSLVESLAQELRMDYALVATVDSAEPASPGDGRERANPGDPEEATGTMARTMAVWARDRIDENFEYALRGTPCEQVAETGFCSFPAGVQQLFPEEPMLAEMEVDSYVGTPLLDSDGQVLGVMVVMDRRPLTDETLARSMLQIFAVRAAAELQRMRAHEALLRTEADLFQAQKMEAVGRLAGGVAHDFNNLLTVVNGFAELVLGATTADDPRRQDLEHIHSAGQSAALLTEKLLAFSRRRTGSAVPIEVNAALESLEPLLRPLLGPDHELSLELGRGSASILLEPGQLDQVVMNLVLNAAAATPDGGLLQVRTRAAQRKDTAAMGSLGLGPDRGTDSGGTVVEVIDTGEGMDAATLQHVFEPFFTTKEPGSGTGLGLATVYAIVKQGNGHIGIRSAPGEGTTVTVVFPEVSDEARPSAPTAAPAGASGDETILLVEDQDMVRTMVRRLLEQTGYRVLEKASAGEALALLEAPDSVLVDLLITDVAMPGMDGLALADRVRELSPSTRILLISGYSETLHLADQGQHPHPFLAKPFSNEELGRMVRELLDATQ